MSNELRDAIRALMENEDLAQTDVARALGVSDGLVSSYLAGKYTGDNSKFEELLKRYLAQLKEKRSSGRFTIPFVVTKESRRLTETIKRCRNNNDLSICIGDSGSGKTVTLKHWAKENPNDIFIEVDPTYSARTLLKDICAKLRIIPPKHGGMSGMLSEVIDRLYQSDRVLLVDEAEYLLTKALEMLRRIHDKAEIGILLAGMPRLYENIRGQKFDFAQMRSRVGEVTYLNPLGEEDVEKIVAAVLGADKAEKLSKAYHKHSRGNVRVLSKILKLSIGVAKRNEREIDEEVIEQSAKKLIL